VSVVPEGANVVPDVRDADVVATVAVGVHRRRASLLVGLGAFQLWLWATRIVNLVGDAGDVTTAFLAVHAVLYATAILAGAALVVLGVRMGREAGAATRAGTGRAG